MNSKLYKRHRHEIVKRQKNETNIHHILNQTNRNQFNNVEHEDNKIRLTVYEHNLLHALFQNMSPHEIFKYLKWIFDGVLSSQSKEMLDALSEDNIYRPLFKKKK